MLRLLVIVNFLLFSANLIAEQNKDNTAIKSNMVKKDNLQQKNIKSKNAPQKIDSFQDFKPFCGKITGNKVRVRTSSDLDSHIISQLNKNDLVLVTKDEKDFWGIKPISNVKGYVFRSYIIDNVIEANRVNVRVEPNLDSPILFQLQNKDKVEGNICASNNKWLEIDLPESVSFYIAKEYITVAGNAEYYADMQKRKNDVDNLVNSAYFITQSECKKPYDEMNTSEAINQFDLIIKEYGDFPQHVQQAKDGLALLQDNFLQKKIAYLEAKANISTIEKKEYLEALENSKKFENENAANDSINNKDLTDKMKFWEPVENSLFATWTTFHPEKKKKDFYREQEINALTIAGIIEGYSQSIKNKPGDFIVLKNDNSKAYLYSTKIDLNKFVGKRVAIQVSPRPNNNFAFPAYFVNSIEIQ